MKMKTLLKITAAIVLAAASQQTLRAHSDVKIGPNGGRVLEFSTNQTVHGEVIEKDGMFHIGLLDKDMKPMPIEKQTLTATTGDRSKPEKLAVETKDGKFVTPIQKSGDHWTIFQFRDTQEAKPVTARLHYIAKACAECAKPDWLCECAMKNKPHKK
jgi:hypothetical protein